MATTPSFVQITEGAGKRLAAATYTENAQVVYDQKVVIGEPYLASYTIQTDPNAGVSIATINDHIVAIMAGASLNVRLRYARIEQIVNATTVGLSRWGIYRLTSAGTGGTVVTPAKVDTADAAAGATAMTLPTAKGTETTLLQGTAIVMRQALLTTGTQPDDLWEWREHPNMKPFIIPAGTSNGIAFKSLANIAAATVTIYVEFTETSF